MIHIRTKNAKEIGMKPENLALTGVGWNKVPNILIDDQRVSSASFIDLATPKSVTFQKSAGGWVSLDSSIQADPRRRRHHGPIFQILTSAGPIRIVYGTLDPSAKAESFALAQKFARDAFLLGRIDVEILTDRDASSKLGHRPKSERGNLVLLGGPFENSFYPISMQDSNVPGLCDQKFPFLAEANRAFFFLLSSFPCSGCFLPPRDNIQRPRSRWGHHQLRRHSIPY